jgi:hypothetical protein
MDQPVTQAHLTAAVKEIIGHFNESQGTQNQRFDKQFTEINAKLDAIMEMVAVRKELRELVRQLQGRGLNLDESQIFVA